MYTMQERKPIMLNTEVYIKLRKLLESYSKQTNRSYSFSDAIEFLLRGPTFIYASDAGIRDYILAFVAKITRNEDILGVLLFGSVAKGTYSRTSDIDIMIISASGFLDTLREISVCLQELDSLYVELLLKKGMLMNITPLIITRTSLKEFNPIYFDFADYGIPLFDRNMVLEKFLVDIEHMSHTRKPYMSGEILEWAK